MSRSSFGLSLVLVVACLPEPRLDFDPPSLQRVIIDGRVHNLQGRRVSTLPSFEFEFDESLDPESVHTGSFVLRQLEVGKACAGLDECDPGLCRAGVCVSTDLSQARLNDLAEGELLLDVDEAPGTTATLEWELLAGHAGAGSRLLLRPTRALRGDTAYELILGGLRDPAGNPLRSWLEDLPGPRFEVLTRKEGSGGPEAHLSRPRAGSTAVPTNLSSVETVFFTSIDLERLEGAQIELESEAGVHLVLGDPEPCGRTWPGACLRWFLDAQLEPQMRYRLGKATLWDRRGRAAVLSYDLDWFMTGEGADLEPPLVSVHTWQRAHCVHFGVHSEEAVELELDYASTVQRAHSEGWWEFAFVDVGRSGLRPWSALLADLAGNQQELAGEVERGAEPDPELVISELLANPLGPEPRAEYVELVVTGTEAVSTQGLYIADLEWAEVYAALLAGEEPPGDPLPELSLGSKEVVLLVADAYDPIENAAAGDGVPGSDIRLIRIGSSIAVGGLKNAGEALSLYRAEPPELLSSYGNWIASDASDFGGVSVQRRDPAACDGAGDWQPALGGKATPGRLP